MKLLNWLRRDRVAEVMVIHDQALRAEAERVVRSFCEPIPCDIEDHYVCAVHRNG